MHKQHECRDHRDHHHQRSDSQQLANDVLSLADAARQVEDHPPLPVIAADQCRPGKRQEQRRDGRLGMHEIGVGISRSGDAVCIQELGHVSTLDRNRRLQ
ncbi:MAG: hypothetical protein B7Z55_08065, partial [Planctomycetales bacterium 12-60-4]